MAKFIKKISKKQFDEILSKRETENIEVVKVIDDFFTEKRGYVFKQPKPKTEVILLFSGGIDSTVAWATLIEEYDYKVYPIVIDRGSTKRAKRELSAVRSVERYFAEKYPENYVEPFHFSVNTIPKEFASTIDVNNVSAENILANFNKNNDFVKDNSNVVLVRTKGISPYLIPFYGVSYANYLNFIKGLNIKDIFVGANFTDGIEVSSQSFTALRSTLFSICVATADYSWNFSSVFLERETGILLEKGGTIELGAKFAIPFEKTWSCYGDAIFQCGDSCTTCVNRRSSFAEVGVEDKTIYLSDLKIKIKNYIDYKIRVMKNFVKNLVKNKA